MINFEDWDEYVPFTELSKPTENPNVLLLRPDDEITFLADYYPEQFPKLFDEIGEYVSEEFTSGLSGKVIRLIKKGQFNAVDVFCTVKNKDIFIIRKGDVLHFLSSYQSNGFWVEDRTLVFSGWEDHITLDTQTMATVTKYTR